MATDPSPDKIDFLDFPPGCGTTDCGNTATHYAVVVCCGEHVELHCAQCRTEALVSREPWHCPRCGKTWEPRGKGFRWGLLNGSLK